MQEQLFSTPLWLLDKEVFDKTRNGSILTISRQQDAVLNKLLSISTMYKLLQFEGHRGGSVCSLAEMIGDLLCGIFSELQSGKSISIYRRNLQKKLRGEDVGINEAYGGSGGSAGNTSYGNAERLGYESNRYGNHSEDEDAGIAKKLCLPGLVIRWQSALTGFK